MDALIQAFLSWQFLFFCLAIGAVVFVFRKLVEYAMENWYPFNRLDRVNENSKLWRELILPISPIIFGQIAGMLADEYPYPEGFNSVSGRIVFGLVAGFSSGLIVKLYNSFIASKVSDFSEKITTTLADKDKLETEDVKKNKTILPLS